MNLVIDDVSKRYSGGEKEIHVFSGLSVEILRHELFGVLGPSGCGKTTFLNLLCGFDRPDRGRVLYGNREVEGPTSEIIMVFQDFNQLLPWKTVAENVSLPLLPRRLKSERKIEKAKISEYLSLVGLEGREGSYPSELSGGMKQRVAIARALAAEPAVLCMDEPFGSLDAASRVRLQGLLLDIRMKSELTVVFVTHDIKEALILCGRIMIIDKLGGPLEFFENDLPIPRDPHSSEFQAKAHYLFDIMSEL
ncbi:MAG: ABC transporter ATP-binding protein [Spirochaetia bacterium]